ncbi:SecC motif protein [Nocardioides sp. HDW12B]|nr:SecC motif protein [Nocardioides sp. HDW12B]
MRSRYAAYALGLEDHLFRTWHPRTRPAGPLTGGGLVWCGLRVLRTEAGGADDTVGVVEFEADHQVPRDGRAGTVVRTMREVSRFERRAGRWVYVDAVT